LKQIERDLNSLTLTILGSMSRGLSAYLHSNGLRSKNPGPERSLGSYDEGSMICPIPQKYVRKTRKAASATGLRNFHRTR